METRANYALIGAFVLMAAVAVIGFVLWLGSSQFNRDYAKYDIVFPGPVTLEEGAAVRYIGIKVGEVESVGIDRRDASMVRTRIRIDKTTPVKTDSTASIELAGITGVTFVQINAGSERAAPLTVKGGQDVPVIASEPNPLTEFFASGAEIAGRAGQTLEQATALLSEDNITTFSNSMKSIETILETVASEDENLVADVRQTLNALQRAGDELSVAAQATTALGQQTELQMAEISQELQQLLVDLRSATREAEAGFAEGRLALTSAKELIEGPTALAINDSRRAAQDLRILMTRLDRIARELEQNPQGFVVGNPLPYEEAR